tara:strand:- start:144 stop:1199 length:1056 start_codon:yes stop_codon:yes gene_type:complete
MPIQRAKPRFADSKGTATADQLNIGQIGGRRNMIINGAMNVAQRSTSATGLGGSSGYFGLDRFQLFFATSGRLTMSQEADGPSGFANSMKLACTTADTSIAATENIILSQAIEAQDLQQLKKGTSDAEKFTLSFYVKGNASAAYSVEVYDADNNRSIGQTFSVTTSWNRVVLTFDADTSGALNDDNGVGFYVNWWLHAGSNYTGGTFNTTWNDYVNNQRAGNTTSFLDSTDRTFFMTGVQLEVGEQATPFEHKSFGEELNLCRRYLYKPDIAGDRIISSVLRPDNKRAFQVFFPVQMRADPTATTTYNADGSSAALASPSVSKEHFRARTDALNATTQDPRLTAFSMDAEL